MSTLDALLNLVPGAVHNALTTDQRNVLRIPAAAPSVDRKALTHPDAGPPGDVNAPRRVVAVLGPGATFMGIADLLLPLYDAATAPTPEDLAKAIVVYNRNTLPAGGWANHHVGLILPLPVEIEPGTGTWIVDAARIGTLAAGFQAGWQPRLTTPPDPLEVPDAFALDAKAQAMTAQPAGILGQTLWTQVLRNPFEAVLLFLAVFRALNSAPRTVAALAALQDAKPEQLALLAGLRAGNAILRRLEHILKSPAPGADPARVAAARTLLDTALGLGGNRTPVPHVELPETAAQQGIRSGSTRVADGAVSDPPGGVHRLVLGRDVAVGRSSPPSFPGRVAASPYLAKDAARLNPGPTPNVRTRALLRILTGLCDTGAGREPLDAVRFGGQGVLTIGLERWTATDLADLLFAFKSDTDSDEFDTFFALHGLDVGVDPADATRHRLLRVNADGSTSALDPAALRALLADSAWAARFRLAALVSTAYRRAQSKESLRRLDPNVTKIMELAATFGPFPTVYPVDLDVPNSGLFKTALKNAEDAAVTTARNAHTPSADTIAAAVVDLTDVSVSKPVYAGYFDDDTFFVGSMAKVAPMYAAHELLGRLKILFKEVRNAGEDTTPQWQRAVLDAAADVWGRQICTGFPGLDTSFPRRRPRFDTMFDITGAADVDFKRGHLGPHDMEQVGEFGTPKPNMRFFDWMTSMVLWSNNTSAGMVIDAIEYPYINHALREGGFFDPATKRGIWISGNYTQNSNTSWKPGVDFMSLYARGALHYKATTNFVATASQVARLLTLADRGKMFDDATLCDAMVRLMVKRIDPGTVSFIADALDPPGSHRTIPSVASKIGIGVPAPVSGRVGIHDCVIIEVHEGFLVRRYVAVIVGGFDRGADSTFFDITVKVLDDAVKARHP